MPPELTEEEYAELQKSKEEREQFRQKAESEAQARLALQQQYQNDIQQVTAYVGSIMNQGGQQQPTPQGQTEEDDELFVQHPKLKQRLGQVEQNAQAQIQRVAGTLVHGYMKDQLENNLRAAEISFANDPAMKPFLKYKGEVAELLRKGIQQDGRLGTMDAVQRAFRLVASEHLDEIVQERSKVRPAEEEDYEVEAGGAPPPPESRAGGASLPPVSLAPGARASVAPAKGSRVRLSWGEKNMAERFDMKPEEYNAMKDDKYEADVLGIKGRRRV